MERSQSEVDAIFDLMCDCDAMTVVKTHWQGQNSGRRYRECGYLLCAYHRWIDQPLGPRAVEVIAELQGRIREMHCSHMRKVNRIVQRYEGEMSSLKTKQAFKVVAMFLVFAVMMSRALTSVIPDNVDEGYDTDDLL